MNTKNNSGPWRSVVKWGLIIGAISFAAGFIGPVLLSTSNLGPLLGIFVTGPIGVLIGALWGAIRWVTGSTEPDVGAVAKWIALIWIITLFYTLDAVSLVPRFAFPGIGVQILIFFASAFLLYSHGTARRLRRVAQQRGRVFLAVNAVIVAMTLFPPVMRPGWGPSAVLPHESASGSIPRVAFLTHPGFDASKNIPKFTVNIRMLGLEWMSMMVAGVLACYLVERRSFRL
jgi:hypothetical protein